MRSFFKNRSLFQQFAISFTITIFLPITIIGGISYLRGTYQLRNMVKEILQQLVVNINSQFDSLINENDWLSLQIANKSDVRQFIESQPDEYYAKYQFKQWGEKEIFMGGMLSRFPSISRVSFIGDNGMIYSVYNDRSGDVNPTQNPTLYDYNEALKKAIFLKENLPPDGSMKTLIDRLAVDFSGANGVSEEKESSANEYYLTFARRIPSRIPFVTNGTVMIDVRARSLDRLIGKVDIKNSFIWVIDDRGQIIYYPDKDRIGMSVDRYITSGMLKQSEGSFTMSWNGEKRFIVYHTSPNTKWKIMAEIPVKDLNMPVNDLGKVMIYTFLFALPLALLVGYLFIRSILKPVRNLERGMKKVQDEEWRKIEGDIPGNEIGNLMHVYNHMVQKISDLIEKVYKTELEQREYQLGKQKAELARQRAEFQALQTQINPHFLYNTLSAINTYAIMAEELEIQEMVEALSRMLRYAVQNPLEPVKIRDEMEHVRNFITIQTYRNKRMPAIDWKVSDYLDFPILRLTLQPLIENIFQHAFPEGIKEGDKIIISAHEEEGMLWLEVGDNGAGIGFLEPGEYFIPGNEKIKLGIGITNVHRRLQIAYGAQYGLIIRRSITGGTRVRMLLPVKEARLELE